MDIKPILEKALEIVSTSWTDKGKAVDAGGHVVTPWDETAVAWNASGAIYKAIGGDLGAVFPLRAIAKEFPGSDLGDVDKVYGKEAVIEAYRSALAKSR